MVKVMMFLLVQEFKNVIPKKVIQMILFQVIKLKYKKINEFNKRNIKRPNFLMSINKVQNPIFSQYLEVVSQKANKI